MVLPAAIRLNHLEPSWGYVSRGLLYCGKVLRLSRDLGCVFCRPDQFSRSRYVDNNSCLLVSSLPSLFYTMTSHRDIYIYEMLRNDYTVPTRCRPRGGMVDPLGCKARRTIR
jgi:hypothetical protein